MNLFKALPEPNDLIKQEFDNKPLNANGHIHSPYSFSAFEDIPQAVDLAEQEGVKVLGINDFYSMQGYREFNEACCVKKVVPLFNIEFIGLNASFQKKGVRVNDPANPGRTYFSGKGLDFPVSLPEAFSRQIDEVKNESMNQISEMIEKVNEQLEAITAPFRLSMNELLEKYAKDLVRERHIAKVLRIKVFKYFQDRKQQMAFLQKLYGGNEPSADPADEIAVEEEIRGQLLKAGKVAYVPEDERAFLSVSEIKEVILQAGGIPCYPVLLDDKNGEYTDFEGDWKKMMEQLKEQGVYAVELIPGRNSLDALKAFVNVFRKNGFFVSFGTEHNNSKLIPLKVSCREGQELDAEMEKAGYEGVCIIAAHQYLRAKGLQGYVDEKGNADQEHLDYFIQIGNKVIKRLVL